MRTLQVVKHEGSGREFDMFVILYSENLVFQSVYTVCLR